MVERINLIDLNNNVIPKDTLNEIEEPTNS